MRRMCLLLCLGSMLLAACGPRGDDDDGSLVGLNPVPVPAQPGGIPPASEGVTITFAARETEIRTYESIAARFHQEYPTINVVIVSMDALLNTSDDTNTDDIARMRHIVMGADTTVEMGISPEVADSGLLLNMKPLMEADASFTPDDFYPGVLARGTFGQRLLVLPRYAWVRLLSYNKDLFRAAGLPDPQPDWTWNDLFGFASQIAAYDGTDYGFFDDSRGITSMFSEIEARKLKLFSVPASDVDLTQPELVHTFEHFKGMIDNHTIYTASRQDSTAPDNPQQLIRDGRVGIFPSALLQSSSAGLSWSPMGRNDYPFSVGYINAPPSDAVLATLGVNMIDGYIISAGTQHPNEAWTWIAYLSRTVIDLGSDDIDMMSRPGRIPARQSLAEATKFWETMDADTKTAAQHALAQQVVRLAHMPDYPTLGALTQAVYAVTQDARQPADALKAAQQQLASQLAEDARATPSPTPPTGAVVVATPAPQVAPDGAVTLVFNPLGYDTAALRSMARTFNDQKNGYFVQMTATDVTTSPVRMADVAKNADCFAWWYPPQGPDDLAALLDLQPFFLADPHLRQDDIPPAVLSQLMSNGGIYGLPSTFNARVLAYNQTMFDAAGLNPPVYTWKPEDFLTAAIALTHGSGDTKQYGYIPLRGPARDMAFFIAQFGGQLATGSGKDVQPNFSDPTVVKAIQWYIDLAKVHGVMPRFTLPYRPEDAPDDTAYALIHAGRGGMWIDRGAGAFPVSSDGSDSTITWQPGLAPLPIGGAGMQRDDLAVRSFYISAQTHQQQGCWEWLTFITSHGRMLNDELPARQSVASSPEFLNSANEIQLQTLKVYGEAFSQPSKQSYSIDELSHLTSSGFDLYWFYKAIDDTIMKHADLAEGLEKADELTKANMTCVAKTQQPARCARQTDPEYDGFATEDPGQTHPNGAMDALR